MPITKEPPCTAVELGSSLNTNHTHSGPTAVSSSINMPTSAAGMRIGPMVIKAKANGLTIRHNATMYHQASPDNAIGLPAKKLTRARISPDEIKAGVMSLWLTARSLTNFAAKAIQHTKASKSPVKLGSDQEPDSTQPIPIIDRIMATQVMG